MKLAADKGYSPAKIKLAWSYIYGEGVELNVDKAREIFEELAEDGNADAHAVSIFLVSQLHSNAKILVSPILSPN